MSPQTSARIVFFGNERLATGVTTTAPTLRGLITHGYNVVAVVVNYTVAQSRSAASRELEVMKVAQAHGIPVFAPEKLRDAAEDIAALEPTAGVLLAYGKIIPQSIIEIFPRGIINIHPSLLPAHRGSVPIESVMLEGAHKTGVSLMQLAKEMDAGPVYAQETLQLTGTESKQALYDSLIELGDILLFDNLLSIINGQLQPSPQDDTKATYDRTLTKEDGTIDWHKPAVQIEREVRTFLEWPKSRTQLAGKDIVVTATHVLGETGKPGTATAKNRQLVVFCGEGAVAIDMLKPAGKQEMTGEAFLAGHKHLL